MQTLRRLSSPSFDGQRGHRAGQTANVLDAGGAAELRLALCGSPLDAPVRLPAANAVVCSYAKHSSAALAASGHTISRTLPASPVRRSQHPAVAGTCSLKLQPWHQQLQQMNTRDPSICAEETHLLIHFSLQTPDVWNTSSSGCLRRSAQSMPNRSGPPMHRPCLISQSPLPSVPESAEPCKSPLSAPTPLSAAV